MIYEAPEIHPYRFLTDIETSASTVKTVNADVHAAIAQIQADSENVGRFDAAKEIFSFEF